MADMKLITANLGSVVAAKSRPGITMWNRLEGRPRTEHFERALRAEIRDALWMITRQWQMGEYRGDDAGSPFFAKAHVETRRLRKYQAADGAVEAIDEVRPLEPHVERLPLRFFHGAPASRIPVSLDLRVAMGRYWLKLVRPLPAAAVPQFKAEYPVDQPDPLSEEGALVCAHAEAWSSFALAGGRLMDGYKLWDYLTADPTHSATHNIAALAGQEAAVAPLAQKFVSWFARLIYQPVEVGAWQPDRMEYRFSVSAPGAAGEKVMVAEQYAKGHLDWHASDFDPKRASLGPAAPEPPEVHRFTMLPVNVTFSGMPNTRWWRFEDGMTNFGAVQPDTTDLGKLMLIEFGLVYANDWFLVPFTLPAGSLAELRGLAVTNVFGERIWVQAAGRGADDDWQRWAMFLISTAGLSDKPADLSLLVPPVALQVMEGKSVEELLVARDEMANMVWAIERMVSLPDGNARLGATAAAETLAWHSRNASTTPAAEPDPVANLRYKVMSTVPEHWIPMVSAHVPGDVRETQLQRAAMVRVIEGVMATPPIEPRTALMRRGLDQTPKKPYFLHEEEVPRGGIQVSTSFQRTRTRTGETLVWLGARKKTGRGEGSSGLAFDRLIPTKRG